jgi:hypothetical protein
LRQFGNDFAKLHWWSWPKKRRREARFDRLQAIDLMLVCAAVGNR